MKTTRKLLIAYCPSLIAYCTLPIANCYSQGSIDIETNIQMGIAGTKHVKITTGNFSIHQDSASPLIYGDFGTGNVGIGTNNAQYELHIIGDALIESSAGAELNLKNTSGNGATWQIVSGVAGGLELGYVEGELIDGDAPFYIRDNGRVGIGTTSPSYLLHVNGSAGKPGGGSWSNSSDRRLKKNIQPVSNGLEQILKLKPVKYQWINPSLHGERQQEIGFLAQDIKEHFPDWVDEIEPNEADSTLVPSGDKIMTLTLPFDFDALVVGAIKELKAEKDAEISTLNDVIGRLTEEIRLLRNELNQLKN